MSFLEHRPCFAVEHAAALADDIYGIHVLARPLPSERDQNLALQTQGGERFVLKIANALEERAMLEAENQAMAHVAQQTALCQRVVLAKSGDAIAEVQAPDGTRHLVRLLTYLPGLPLGRVRWHSPRLLFDLGRSIGRIDLALRDFDHPAIHRDFHWDLANSLDVFREYGALIQDAELGAVVASLAADFERTVAPLLPRLPTSAIHNDANDYNVIVDGGSDLSTRNQRVSGLIDWGDMVYSATVGDLAVAVAYAVLDKADPLAAAALVVQGYHGERRLSDDELTALFGLACMRLCASACIAAHQVQQRPGDEYLAISQGPIRRTLPRLAQIHPRLAEATFRHACGLVPVPHSVMVNHWLAERTPDLAPVLGIDLRKAPSVVLDLGVSSALVSGDERENDEPHLSIRLSAAMAAAGAEVGIGRYGEPRLLYSAAAFAGASPTDERRTVHLGIDLFAEAGTPVCAPLAGVVRALADNDAPQDYGPLVILEHAMPGGAFCTLYGHLSRASLSRLHVGQAVAQGEPFAALGAAHENGGWPPHLHFQVIADLLGLDGGFPGVVRPSQWEVWQSFSPDPNVILGIPAERFPPAAPGRDETLATRRTYIGPSLRLSYDEPVKIVRGWMQYLYNEEGRRYLDAYNNVPHVGHCHPRVVRAAREQMALLNTNTRYLHDLVNRYARQLCALLPAPLSVCFFVNSGSEANELALRLARAHTGQRDTIVLEAAYHGHTTTLIDISPYKHDGPGGAGAPPWVHTVPIPDVYRGPYRREDAQAGIKYAQHVSQVTERLRQAGRGLAAYIAESLPSVGGQIVFPDHYLDSVYRAVRKAGGVCIADEVQTGYGRIGTHFWGFERYGAAPDIVVLGKPIGNGHPIGVVITTPEIAASFDNGMEFFSTFGGNTVSCAVGLAVLDIVLEEQLQAHALRVGEQLLGGLRPLADRYDIVGDVRGSGLFLGVELVRDRLTREPATAEASWVVNRLRERGILLGTDGPFHNVIKIRPPMPFSRADADLLVAMLTETLEEAFT